MKKIISAILVFAMLFAFAGCNQSKKEVLKVATSPDFAPMEFVDSSKKGQDAYVGFDISLAKYIDNAKVDGVDISKRALTIAKLNAKQNNVDVSFINSNLFEEVASTYDVIVSNPPYIRKRDMENLQKEACQDLINEISMQEEMVVENVPDPEEEEQEEKTPLIFGRTDKIKEQIVKIEDLTPDYGRVAIEGKVISTRYKNRNKKRKSIYNVNNTNRRLQHKTISNKSILGKCKTKRRF
mgnify:CR=1 FL=1